MFKIISLAPVFALIFTASAQAGRPSQADCAKLRVQKFQELRDELVGQVHPQIENNEKHLRRILDGVWADRRDRSKEFVDAYNAKGAFSTRDRASEVSDLLRLYLKDSRFDEVADSVRCGSDEIKTLDREYGWVCKLTKYPNAGTKIPLEKTSARAWEIRGTKTTLPGHGADLTKQYSVLSSDGSRLALLYDTSRTTFNGLELSVCTTLARQEFKIFGVPTRLWDLPVCSEIDLRKSRLTSSDPTIVLDEVSLFRDDKMVAAIEKALPESCRYATTVVQAKAPARMKISDDAIKTVQNEGVAPRMGAKDTVDYNSPTGAR